MPQLLQLSVIRLPGVVWVQLEGELDVSCDRRLTAATDAALAPEDFLVLDARGITFCDVVGLRLLTDVLEGCSERGQAACCLLSAPVERVATLLSAERLLARVESAELLAHVASATVGDLDPPIAAWQAPAGASADSGAPPRAAVGSGARSNAVSARRDLEAIGDDSIALRASTSALMVRQCLVVAKARHLVEECRGARDLRAAWRRGRHLSAAVSSP